MLVAQNQTAALIIGIVALLSVLWVPLGLVFLPRPVRQLCRRAWSTLPLSVCDSVAGFFLVMGDYLLPLGKFTAKGLRWTLIVTGLAAFAGISFVVISATFGYVRNAVVLTPTGAVILLLLIGIFMIDSRLEQIERNTRH